VEGVGDQRYYEHGCDACSNTGDFTTKHAGLAHLGWKGRTGQSIKKGTEGTVCFSICAGFVG